MSWCLKWVAVKDGGLILCGVRAVPKISPFRLVLDRKKGIIPASTPNINVLGVRQCSSRQARQSAMHMRATDFYTPTCYTVSSYDFEVIALRPMIWYCYVCEWRHVAYTWASGVASRFVGIQGLSHCVRSVRRR